MIVYLFFLCVLFLISFFYQEIILLYTINYQKEKSHSKALIKSLKISMWMVYLILYQKIYKNIEYIQKFEYDVHYVYNGQLYKIKILGNSNINKKQVLMITNENSDDITSDILPYMGPKYDFHSIKYTPKNFKIKELTLYLNDGNIKKFDENQTIIIN
jgi:hypothetical protein